MKRPLTLRLRRRSRTGSDGQGLPGGEVTGTVQVDRKRVLASRQLHRAMVEHLQADRPIEMSVILAAHFADGSVVMLG